MNAKRLIVGLAPALPPPLAQSRWWTEPVPAERWAAFRIAFGAALFLDVVGTYWPVRRAVFGDLSLGDPSVFASRTAWPLWNWSLLEGVTSPWAWDAALVLWAAAALCLTVGWCSRRAALAAWALSITALNTNYFIHNGGDRLRTLALFYLMLSPCAATWSLDAVRCGLARDTRPRFIAPWPLRLAFLQLVTIYFFSGLLKEKGTTWQSGEALWLVMTNAAWTRWSYLDLPVWPLLAQALTWVTLAWELAFPLLVVSRRTRVPALLIGAWFHVATGVLLKLGMFPVYALCLYLPLLPWERVARRTDALPSDAFLEEDGVPATEPEAEAEPALAAV